MDVQAFCRQSNVVVLIGKGGVGRTTASAALAQLAAESGLDVLVLELEDVAQLEKLFEAPPLPNDELRVLWSGSAQNTADSSPVGKKGQDPPAARGQIRAEIVSAEGALNDYLEERGAGWVGRQFLDLGALDVVATAAPGIKAMVILTKIVNLERAQKADLIVVDAPATGHAVGFLSTPAGFAAATNNGPLHTQARELLEFLSDPSRCQVMLVTIPEETPVNEAVETGFRLEDTVGVALGPVIVNACYLERKGLDADIYQAALEAGINTVGQVELEAMKQAGEFRLRRQRLQANQCVRLRNELPVPQLRLPYVFRSELGPNDLDVFVDALRVEIENL